MTYEKAIEIIIEFLQNGEANLKPYQKRQFKVFVNNHLKTDEDVKRIVGWAQKRIHDEEKVTRYELYIEGKELDRQFKLKHLNTEDE